MLDLTDAQEHRYVLDNPTVIREVDQDAPHAVVDGAGRVQLDVEMSPPRNHVPDYSGRTTVIYCANQSFYPGLAASLSSLLHFHPNIPVVVYSWGLSPAQERWLSRFVTVLPRDPALPDDPVWGRIGLLKLDIPRAIYLDADTIVLKPITGLIESQSVFGAAPNLDWGIVENFKDGSLLRSLGLDPNTRAFNSGVFTMNVEALGAKLYDRILELERLYAEHFILGDQSAFQLVFNLEDLGFEFIGVEFNTMAEFHDWDADPDTPCIVHYAGPDKPWISGCAQPAQSHFFRWSRIPDPVQP